MDSFSTHPDVKINFNEVFVPKSLAETRELRISDNARITPSPDNLKASPGSLNRSGDLNGIESPKFCEKCVHHQSMHQNDSANNSLSRIKIRDKSSNTIRIPNSSKGSQRTVKISETNKTLTDDLSLEKESFHPTSWFTSRNGILNPSANHNPTPETHLSSPRFPKKLISRFRSISASHPVEFNPNVTRSASLIEESDEDDNDRQPSVSKPKVLTNPKAKSSYTFGTPAHTLFKRKPRVNTLTRADEGFSSTLDCSNPKYSSSAQQPDAMFESLQGAVDIISTRGRSISHVFERPPNFFNLNKAVDCNTHIVISKSIDKDVMSEPFNRRNFQSFDKENMIIVLFQHSTAYDVMPNSAKFVILDAHLPIPRSIQCLLENGIQAAPIWNSSKYSFIGNFNQITAVQLLATVINDSSTPPKSFNPASLIAWRDKTLYEVLYLFEEISIEKYNYCPINLFSKNLFVSPMLSLVDVIKHFIIPYEVVKKVDEKEEKVYKVPPPCQVVIVDPNLGNSIGLITIDRLISYVRLVLDKLPHSDVLRLSISRIISYTDRILSSDPNNWSNVGEEGEKFSILIDCNRMNCLEALQLFDKVLRKFSLAQLPAIPWIPVMDNGSLAGILSPGDILYYFLEGVDIDPVNHKVSKIINSKYPTCLQQKEYICDSQDTILQIIDKMYRLKTTMLLIYDRNEKRFTGLITAIDLLSFLLDLPIGSLEDQPKMSHSCNCCCCKCQLCMSDSNQSISRLRVCSANEDSLFKMDAPEENAYFETNKPKTDHNFSYQKKSNS